MAEVAFCRKVVILDMGASIGMHMGVPKKFGKFLLQILYCRASFKRPHSRPYTASMKYMFKSHQKGMHGLDYSLRSSQIWARTTMKSLRARTSKS